MVYNDEHAVKIINYMLLYILYVELSENVENVFDFIKQLTYILKITHLVTQYRIINIFYAMFIVLIRLTSSPNPFIVIVFRWFYKYLKQINLCLSRFQGQVLDINSISFLAVPKFDPVYSQVSDIFLLVH